MSEINKKLKYNLTVNQISHKRRQSNSICIRWFLILRLPTTSTSSGRSSRTLPMDHLRMLSYIKGSVPGGIESTGAPDCLKQSLRHQMTLKPRWFSNGINILAKTHTLILSSRFAATAPSSAIRAQATKTSPSSSGQPWFRNGWKTPFLATEPMSAQRRSRRSWFLRSTWSRWKHTKTKNKTKKQTIFQFIKIDIV